MTGKSKKWQAAAEFEVSRKEELDGLIENGTFIPTRIEDIPEGTRVFVSRFIDQLKRPEKGIRKKSRLVAQNYADI